MERPKRILVVEDNVQTAEYLIELLQARGYETAWAFDREEVFQKLRGASPDAASVEQAFDLVLLDLMLSPGGVEGFEICRRIKSDDVLQHTAVIMVTGLGSTVNKARGLETGADDYVTKPFIPEELLARIHAALRVREMEQVVVQRNRELAALNEISRLTGQSLDLDQVLMATLNQTLSAMAGRAALIALVEADGAKNVVLYKHRGIPLQLGEAFDHARWQPGQGLIGQTAQSGKRIVAISLHDDPHLAALIPHGLDIVACVPLSTQQSVIGVLAVLAQDGGQWGEHSFQLLEAIGRQVGGAIENARLYTQVRQYAEDLSRSQAQLVQAEKLSAMGRLIIYISHELNNPLQAVQNCLHLVLNRSLSKEKNREFLTMAQAEVERLIGTVQRMLDFSRPSGPGENVADVHAILQDVLALSSKRLVQANVRVRRTFANDIPRLHANEDQLKQVFLNLVLNAVDAMPNGGQLTLATRLDQDKQWAYIDVHDEGIGLSSEAMKHVFEPFYTTKSQGTGVGLAISYGLIEQHGGDIQVQSQESKGSCFTVRLPVRMVG
ncbi:MAG: response regulator [Anaerolineae bacterium]|nr:response regulator [Anaerolineae bacterium]